MFNESAKGGGLGINAIKYIGGLIPVEKHVASIRLEVPRGDIVEFSVEIEQSKLWTKAKVTAVSLFPPYDVYTREYEGRTYKAVWGDVMEGAVEFAFKGRVTGGEWEHHQPRQIMVI